MKHTLDEIARFVEGRLVGDGGVEIKGVSGAAEAGEGDLAFVEKETSLSLVNNTKASGVLVAFEVKDANKPVIICKNPSLAITRIINKMFPHRVEHPAGIDARASIAADACLGRGVAAGAGAYIGAGVTIGEGTVIYPLAFVGRGSSIGSNCVIYPNVTVREGSKVGNNVIIHSSAVIGSDGFGFVRDGGTLLKVPQTGNVVIEDDVEIGAAVTIDRARFGSTSIGEGTKIDNLVQIAHNVRIGKHCVIAALTGISGSVTIADNAVIGGQVGIADHVNIGEGAMIASKAGITKSVPPKAVMSGIPARPHRITKRLIGHIDNLPKTAARLDEIEKRTQGLRGEGDAGESE